MMLESQHRVVLATIWLCGYHTNILFACAAYTTNWVPTVPFPLMSTLCLYQQANTLSVWTAARQHIVIEIEFVSFKVTLITRKVSGTLLLVEAQKYKADRQDVAWMGRR